MRLTLTRREKLYVGAFAAVSLGAVFFVLVHRPVTTRVEALRVQVAEAEAALAKDRARLVREGDLDAREAAVKAQEQIQESLAPGRHAAALFVHYLSRIEQQAGVQIRSLRGGERKGNGDLVELTMELEVDGTFASHILFQQNLQGVPLFFSLQRWQLDRDRAGTLARAGELVSQGRPWEAETLLREHPRLKGTYQFHVYFEPRRAGLDPRGAGAVPAAGRPDPFVDDRIDEFVDELQNAYRGASAGHGQATGTTGPARAPGLAPVPAAGTGALPQGSPGAPVVPAVGRDSRAVPPAAPPQLG